MFHSANTLNTAHASWGVRRQMRFLFLWRLENFTLYVNFKNFMLFLEDFSFFLLILVYASAHACSCSFISDTMRGHESTLCVALCPGSVLFCFPPTLLSLQMSDNSPATLGHSLVLLLLIFPVLIYHFGHYVLAHPPVQHVYSLPTYSLSLQ